MHLVSVISSKPFLLAYLSSLSSKTYRMIDTRIIVRGNRLIGLCIAVLAIGLNLTSCTKEPIEDSTPYTAVSTGNNEGFLYCSDYSGNFEIWKFEDEQHIQLTVDEEWDCWWPQISPSGGQILYYKSKAGRDANDFDNASLWVMTKSGQAQQELIAQDAFGWIMQGLANWSYDETQIVMAAVDPGIGTWQLYLTDPEGRSPERISTRDDVNYLDPIFDIDDQFVFCSVAPEGLTGEADHEIFKIDILTGEEIRLTNNSVSDHHPALSPDGEFLVYETLDDPSYLSIGKWSINELNLTTFSETVILEDDQINLFPKYDATGEYIYYTRLNVESFLMTGARLNRSDLSSSLLVPTDRNSFNLDPYSF